MHLRSPVSGLAWTAAAATALALLAGFAVVLRQAVAQGEQRRLETARQALARWRCTTLPDRAASAACLVALRTAPRPEAASGGAGAPADAFATAR